MASFAVFITSWWTKAKTPPAYTVDHQLNVQGSAIDDHVSHLEMQAAKPVIQALSFVYAWALLNTLDELVFGCMLGCGTPTQCTYQSNLAYAVIITVLFANVDNFLKSDPNKDVVTRSVEKSMRVTAMFLTTGWAWMNYFTVFVNTTTPGASRSHVGVVYVELLLCYGCLISLLYHAFLEQKRAWDKERKDDEIADSVQC